MRRNASYPTDPHERRAILVAKRNRKMARSAHAYVRGSTERFYEWLDSSTRTALPTGPSVWICGDCHVGNLGPIARVTGPLIVELRDLDQTVIGNPAFDLLRLALSLAMAARGANLPGVTTARMTENLVDGYTRAFEGEIASEEIGDLPPPIRWVMKRAGRRTWKQFSEERIGNPHGKLTIGAQFWPLTDRERDGVQELIKTEGIRRLVTVLEARSNDSEVRLLDAAYWVKGCSSLGLWRAAALVEVNDPKQGKTRALLDLKEAIETWAPAAERDQLPKHQGERVATGALKLAPALGARMTTSTILDHEIFVRELLPQDLKVELDELSREEGKRVATYLGLVVGRAHARQLDRATRNDWLRTLTLHRGKGLEAPSWLWSSLVELTGLHEKAYLEHCRRYALLDDDKAARE